MKSAFERYLGGIVFHKKDGTLIEVDKDAFRLLEQLQIMQIIDEKEILDNFSTFQIHPSRIKRCLTNLRELGVICRIEDKIPNKKQQPKNLQFNQTHLKKIIDYSTNPYLERKYINSTRNSPLGNYIQMSIELP